MVVLIYVWNNASFKIPCIFKPQFTAEILPEVIKDDLFKGERGQGEHIPYHACCVYRCYMGTISMKRCYNIQSSSDSDLVEFQCRRSHDT